MSRCIGNAQPAIFNLDAEQALLGAILFDNTAMRAAEGVRPDHFHEPFHQRLFEVSAELIRAGQTAEPIVLMERFRRDPAFEDLGGLRYLADLVDQAPPSANARTYALLITDVWARRSAAALCMASATEIADGSDRPAAAHLAQLRQALEAVEIAASDPGASLVAANDAGDHLLEALDREAVEGRDRGALTGLRCIDRRMRGLRPGWLVVIGGRPSMGKTALARAIAYGAAERNPASTVLFFALEMDRREITERALSALSFASGDGVPYVDMGGASLPLEDRQRLRFTAKRLPGNLLIDDRPTLSVDDVRRAIWAAKRKGPVAVAVVDYLQLMTRPEAQGRNEASVIGEMTSTLKRVAKETGVCIVLLSQLSRGVESRDDKRPQLSDLRESGSIEQDANAVLFPFRPVYYTERAEPAAGTPEHGRWAEQVEIERRRLDVIAAKVRGGAIGTDRQACFIEYDHVADLEDVA